MHITWWFQIFLLPVSNLCLKWITFKRSLFYTKRKWKYTENTDNLKHVQQFLNYFYYLEHLQSIAFGTMKFNRLIKLLGFKRSQLCFNSILLRSSAVQNSFQYRVTHILMICQYCKITKKTHMYLLNNTIFGTWGIISMDKHFALIPCFFFSSAAASVLLIQHATSAVK